MASNHSNSNSTPGPNRPFPSNTLGLPGTATSSLASPSIPGSGTSGLNSMNTLFGGLPSSFPRPSTATPVKSSVTPGIPFGGVQVFPSPTNGAIPPGSLPGTTRPQVFTPQKQGEVLDVSKVPDLLSVVTPQMSIAGATAPPSIQGAVAPQVVPGTTSFVAPASTSYRPPTLPSQGALGVPSPSTTFPTPPTSSDGRRVIKIPGGGYAYAGSTLKDSGSGGSPSDLFSGLSGMKGFDGTVPSVPAVPNIGKSTATVGIPGLPGRVPINPTTASLRTLPGTTAPSVGVPQVPSRPTANLGNLGTMAGIPGMPNPLLGIPSSNPRVPCSESMGRTAASHIASKTLGLNFGSFVKTTPPSTHQPSVTGGSKTHSYNIPTFDVSASGGSGGTNIVMPMPGGSPLDFTGVPNLPQKTGFDVSAAPPLDPEQFKVKLFPSQKDNVARHLEILKSSYFTSDESIMGAGKTYMTAAVIQEIKPQHVIVITPAGNIADTWKKISVEFRLPTVAVMSYEKLASRKRGLASHGLLIREQDDNGKTYFTPTQYLVDMINSGLVLVCDERSKIKNPGTDNHKAVAAIVNFICSNYGSPNRCPSRCIFLSATPFDDPKQKIGFLRMIGLIRHHFLYRNEQGFFQPLGAQELREACEAIDKEETDAVFLEHTFSKGTVEEICAILCDRVITKHYSTAAPGLKIEGVSLDCKNEYYNISPQREVGLSNAVDSLHSSVRFRGNGEVDTANTNWSGITTALVHIEYNKVEVFVRKAIEDMAKYPTCKICIMLNYKVPVRLVANFLSAYRPLILEGSMKEEERARVRELFQEENLNYRVIVCNIVVASMGIDFDDKNGNFPRRMYISPGYRAMVLHQASHRIYRVSTKSNAIVRLVFGKCGRRETSILNALARRKAQMKSSVPHQLELGVQILFPGEYEEIEEDDLPGEEVVSYLDYQIEGLEYNDQEEEQMADAMEAGEIGEAIDPDVARVAHMSKEELLMAKPVIPQSSNMLSGLDAFINGGAAPSTMPRVGTSAGFDFEQVPDILSRLDPSKAPSGLTTHSLSSAPTAVDIGLTQMPVLPGQGQEAGERVPLTPPVNPKPGGSPKIVHQMPEPISLPGGPIVVDLNDQVKKAAEPVPFKLPGSGF